MADLQTLVPTDFTHATDDLLQRWSTAEKIEIEDLQQFFNSEQNSEDEFSSDDFDKAVEIIWVLLVGKLSLKNILPSLKEVIQNGSIATLPVLLLEALSTVSNEIGMKNSLETDPKPVSEINEFQNLASLLHDLCESGVLQREICLSRLDLALLVEAAINEEESIQTTTKRVIRINTIRFFKQRKFNLISEANSGFACLIHELFKFSLKPFESFENTVLSLIGKYQLDPNRVLAILFDALIQLPSLYRNDVSIKILVPIFKKIFGKEDILSLIVFKLNSDFPSNDYSEAVNFISNQSGDFSKSCPHRDQYNNSFEAVGFLVKNKLVDPEECLKHLRPTIDESRNTLQGVLHRYSEESKTYGKVSLVSKADAREEAEKSRRAGKSFKSALEFAITYDFKSQMIAGMIRQDLVPEARQIISSLDSCLNEVTSVEEGEEPPSGLTMLDSRIVSSALLSLVERKIQMIEDGAQVEKCFFEIVELLLLLKFRVGQNVRVLTLVIRLLRQIQTDRPDHFEQQNEEIMKLYEKCILPSVILCEDMNANLESDLFKVIKAFPYQRRYSLYYHIETNLFDSHPLFLLQRAKTRADTKWALRRVANDKDIIILTGKKLKKLAQKDTFNCFQTLLQNIQTYDNLSELMVGALRNSSSLSFDILSFLLVNNFNRISQSFSKATNPVFAYEKLRAMANFSGFFYKKNYFCELCGLMNYLLMSLENGIVNNVLILESLLEKMGNQMILDNISPETLAALAGSQLLRKFYKMSKDEARDSFIDSGSTRRVSQVHFLKRVLIDGKFAVPLVVNLALLRERVVVGKEFQELYPKATDYATNVDKITQVFLQLTEFLKAELSDEEYQTLFDDFDTISEEFHLKPWVFFHVTRPIILKTFEKLKDIETKSQTLRKDNGNEEILLDLAKRASELKSNKWFLFGDKLQSLTKYFIQHEIPDLKDNVIKSSEIVWPNLYLLFWCLDAHSLNVPTEAYDDQISKIESHLQLDNRERSYEDQLSSRDKEKMKAVQKQLQEDKESHKARFEMFFEMFFEMKDLFLPTTATYEQREQSIWAFLRYCILPRSSFSEEDAFYCSKFITLAFKTLPTFSLNLVLKMVPITILVVNQCTELEAKSLSTFLAMFLNMVGQVRTGNFKTGLVAQSNGDAELVTEQTAAEFSAEMDQVFGLLTKTMSDLLRFKNNNENIVRSTLIIGSAISTHYPSSVTDASRMKLAVNMLLKQDNDETKIMAKRYLAQLEKRLRDGQLQGRQGALSSAKKGSRNGASRKRGTRSKSRENDRQKAQDTMSVESGEIEVKKTGEKKESVTKKRKADNDVDKKDEGDVKRQKKDPSPARSTEKKSRPKSPSPSRSSKHSSSSRNDKSKVEESGSNEVSKSKDSSKNEKKTNVTSKNNSKQAQPRETDRNLKRNNTPVERQNSRDGRNTHNQARARQNQQPQQHSNRGRQPQGGYTRGNNYQQQEQGNQGLARPNGQNRGYYRQQPQEAPNSGNGAYTARRQNQNNYGNRKPNSNNRR